MAEAAPASDAQRPVQDIAIVRSSMIAMEDQFKAALPAHIPVERFVRVVMTAIQNNPDLLKCDRRSLFNSAMKAAQDGLLPDGRDGAMVPYKGEVTWMPMIGGIRKKARNSGEISTWDVHAVFQNDAFEYELGDDPFIKHKPALANRGELIAVYSVATLKDGSISRDIMSKEDVEKIRALSRAANGPWSKPTFYPEMAKKTVARRHSKVLPMSSDLDDLIRRDDGLYDLAAASDKAVAGPRARNLSDRMEQLAGGSLPAHDAETGEIIDAKPKDDGKSASQTDAPKDKAKPDQEQSTASADPYFDAGKAAKAKGMSRRAIPGDLREEDRKDDAERWYAGYDSGSSDTAQS